MMIRDSHSRAQTDWCINSLANIAIFSTLGGNSKLWQILIPEEDRDRTVLTSHNSLFHFNHMTFRLKNAAQVFQRAMDALVTKLKWQFPLVSEDDIIVFLRTPDVHIDQGWPVLTFNTTLEWHWTWRNVRFYKLHSFPLSCRSPLVPGSFDTNDWCHTRTRTTD